jgi:hypothetical protein
MAESTTYDSKRTGTPDLRILHFNDVYHVEYVRSWEAWSSITPRHIQHFCTSSR